MRVSLVPAAVVALIAAALVWVAAPAAASTYAVNTTADTFDGTCDADCSLRDAMAAASAASGPDTVVLQAGATYQLTECDPAADDASVNDLDHEANEALTVEGNGATIEQTCVGVNANPDNRILDHGTASFGPADPANVLTLRRLTVTGGAVRGAPGQEFPALGTGNPGETVQGGGVRSQGHVVLDDASFHRNVAQGGPGIASDTAGAGGDALGGALHARGSVVASGGVFTGNDAIGGRGGPGDGVIAAGGGDGFGGAVWAPEATFTGTVFGETGGTETKNRAIGGQGGENTAVGKGGTGGEARGGMAYIGSGPLTLEGVTLIESQALGGAGGWAGTGTAGDGGDAAAGAAEAGHIAISGGQVTASQALGGGSGIAPAGGGTGGAGHGGAFRATAGDATVVVENATLTDNIARALHAGDAAGGAIAADVVDITSSSFESNVALAGNASDPTVGDGGHARGGAVQAVTATVDSGTFVSNRAAGGGAVTGAASPHRGGDAIGGAVHVDALVTVTSSEFASNLALAGRRQGGDPASAIGGAVASGAVSGTPTVVDSSFSGNRADGTDDGVSVGGALGLEDEGARWSVDGTTFLENGANNLLATGGAVAGDGDVRNSTFHRNYLVAPSGADRIGTVMAAGSASLEFVTVTSSSGADPLAVESLTLSGSVLTANSSTTVCDPVYVTTVTAGSAPNWVADASCDLPDAQEHAGEDPLLGSLQDNGGPTDTRAPASGSPLLDAAGTVDCPPTDQRGFTRPYGSGCDIGAVEVQPIGSPGGGGGDGGEAPLEPRDISDACPPDEVLDAGFADVDAANVHATAIHCLSTLWNVAEGRASADELVYGPDEPVRRDQMASFVARAIEAAGGSLPSDPADAFGDDDASVHERQIDQLAQLGIVAGRGDVSYGPADPVRRDQMAKFLAEAYRHITGDTLTSTTDFFVDDGDSVHEADINGLAGAAIAAGDGNGRYLPAAAVRRDQMASYLARLLDLLVEEGHTTLP